MHQYLHLMKHVLEDGAIKSDRTGTGTRSIFGWQMRFDLSRGFPLLTTKKLHARSIIYELLWFLRGDTNIRWLNDNGVSIWDDWADPRTGELGPVYGHQWRSWPTAEGGAIDQISNLIAQIRTNPDSRRLIVSAWNVADVEHMALPPCHCLFQFYVTGGREPTSVKSGHSDTQKGTALTESGQQERVARRRLSCQLYQRSADLFLGVPFNIASYALLTMMIAQVCDLEPGEFIHTIGDAHLYSNHVEQAHEQLSREPRGLPEMWMNPEVKSIFDFRYEDFKLRNYEPHPHIKAPVAV